MIIGRVYNCKKSGYNVEVIDNDGLLVKYRRLDNGDETIDILYDFLLNFKLR